MSRIGKRSITIPAWCSVTLTDTLVTVKWPKGTLTYTVPTGVIVNISGTEVTVSVISEEYNNMWGLVRTLIDNMVVGVSQGFEKKLHVIGVGFSAKATGQNLTMNLGFSHPVDYTAPAWISFSAEKDPKGSDIVTVQGIDKQLVGQVAASLRALRKPEPYKGKGVRYLGEKVRQKAGKTAGK